MTFFSGETIKERLNTLITDQNGNAEGNENRIDCNSYELTIGPEAYVTVGTNTKPKYKNILRLQTNESFTISSGQFALIITQEFVNIPKDVFGLISMKTKFKFLGLVNISGFHVDPGYKGRLLFTVYNAGPDDILLKCGERAFSIWFSFLDNKNSTFIYNDQKSNYNRSSITSDDVNKINGELYSPQILSQRIQKVESALKWKWTTILGVILIPFVAGIGVTLFGNFLTYLLSDKVGYTRELKDDILLDLKDALKTNAEKIEKLQAEIDGLTSNNQKSNKQQ